MVAVNNDPRSLRARERGQLLDPVQNPTAAEQDMAHEDQVMPAVAGRRLETIGKIVERLSKEINAALADPRMKARLNSLGGTVLDVSPSEFGTLIADETQKWAKVVKFSGAKVG